MNSVGKIPILIGVTGHRDVRTEDSAALKLRVREGIAALKRMCPSSPIYMLNSLAEGADQLCAKAAADESVPVIAILPRSRESYAADFKGEALERFNRLCDGAKNILVSPDIEGRGEATNDYGYRQAGIYMAEHCHILFALWNGDKFVDRNGCGTANAVDFTLHHSYSTARGSQLPVPGAGFVYWIGMTRRDVKGASPSVTSCYLSADSESATMPDALKSILKKTERFNSEAIPTENLMAHTLVAADNDNPLEKCSPLQLLLHQCYSRATKASSRYQKKYKQSLGGLALFSVLTVLFFMVYDALGSGMFLFPCVLSICASWFICLCAGERHGAYHKRFIEYRALAEVLRTQFYLSACGVEDSVCDYFSWSQRLDIAWIRNAICALMSDENKPSALPMKRILDSWIWNGSNDSAHKLGQLTYHKWRIKRDYGKVRRRELTSRVMLFVSVLAYLALCLLELVFPEISGHELPIHSELVRRLLFMSDGQELAVSGLIKVTMTVSAAVTLFLSSYYGNLPIEQGCDDSEKMIKLFTVAYERINDDSINSKQILRELAHEEILENGVWLSYYRDSGLEINL